MDKITLGGQAVIEGVLIRSPNHYAVAVRKPDNKISVKTEKYVSYTKKNKFFGFLFIRGVITLFETVIVGMKALIYSANESGEEKEELTAKELAFTVITSIVVALLIFKFVPLLLANVLSKNLGLSNFWFNIFDGIIKIFIFVLYLVALSFMDDVKRLFEYHGAEHMSVHCYESKKKLTVKNVKTFKTLHPRCGTEFLLLVLFTSIIFYMFIPFEASLMLKYVYRIILLPVIAGVSYELLKLSGKHYDKILFKIIAWPGMMLQKITTSKPSDDQIEVAIESLKAAFNAENSS
ncbi:hypothetical protein CMO90_03610 [Candidatus Woesearchaeota archaeon]|jgi:uncharacterized protein YqhQ|nr:hypothetical protein [Candidatus Woesearchaeota archaeon]